jgi:ankyrin repeat protein
MKSPTAQMPGRCTPFMTTLLQKIFGLKKESLFDAISKEDLATFKSLLEKGHDPNELDTIGQTPLFRIVYNTSTRQVDFLNVLLSFGSTIDFQKDDGTTALFFAKSKIAKLLLEKGASINVRSIKGSLPIHLSTDIESTNLFIDYGADINARDFSQASPLHHYVYFGSDLVDFAIKKGADVNAKDIDGRTPLINLSRTMGFDTDDNIEIIKTAEILLNAGADIKWKDKDGMTAYDNALDSDVNNYDLAKFLESVSEQ